VFKNGIFVIFFDEKHQKLKPVKLILKNYGTFQSFILVLEKNSFKGDIKLGGSLRLFSESDFEIDYVPKEM